jgi:uncharacterized protein YbbC (DUF1343 family)
MEYSLIAKDKNVFFSQSPVWEDSDPVLRSGCLGLLCNQTAWHPETGEYLFETFFRRGVLKRVFLPEHGLFGELQDQEKLDEHKLYTELGFKDCEFVSLYGSSESTLSARPENLRDLDALLVDLQDVGVRYYTYLSTLRNLFITLSKENIPLPVWIVDRENPAGSTVEGCRLKKEYASFIGIEGIPHRHGLTIGEMALYFRAEIGAAHGAIFPLHIVSYNAGKTGVFGGRLYPWTIPPSPNIPGYFTCDFYSGQCLWEGTNVSEGRGTTRPFEVFGAPWMENFVAYNKTAGYESWNEERHPLFDPGAALRWQRFIPVFHKYSGERCFGFQLIRRGGVYHALLHALRIIRFVRENCEGFSFRPRKYEAGSEKTAIELLTGDSVLLSYIRGEGVEKEELTEFFKREEEAWIEKTREFRLYEEPLKSAASF